MANCSCINCKFTKCDEFASECGCLGACFKVIVSFYHLCAGISAVELLCYFASDKCDRISRVSDSFSVSDHSLQTILLRRERFVCDPLSGIFCTFVTV